MPCLRSSILGYRFLASKDELRVAAAYARHFAARRAPPRRRAIPLASPANEPLSNEASKKNQPQVDRVAARAQIGLPRQPITRACMRALRKEKSRKYRPRASLDAQILSPKSMPVDASELDAWTEIEAAPIADLSNEQQSGFAKPSESRLALRPRIVGVKVEKRQLSVRTLKACMFQPIAVSDTQLKPPKLCHGLDRVLFNPGVYQLQDPRSKVFNFDPYLAKIMPVQDFDFDMLAAWTTSSRDETLLKEAKNHKLRFCGSSSSMTSILAHIHYLISQWRPPNMSGLSRGFPAEKESQSFAGISKVASSSLLVWKDGVYAIDSDSELDSATVLSMMGRSMEKLLTVPKGLYEQAYGRASADGRTADVDAAAKDVHLYSKFGDILMRSQLDAHDSRLPGSGVFDLKTRACLPVRMDVQNYRKRNDYEIRRMSGLYESFEREYFDLIRAAFLKYSLQVRIGKMDGIFVAYHNTQRIFGFQYVSLAEMDLAIHGTEGTALGDLEFNLSLGILNDILNLITKRFHNRSVRLHFETRDARQPFMYVFAQPVTEEQLATFKQANKAAVEAMERSIVGALNENAQDEERSALVAEEEKEEAEQAQAAAETFDDQAEWPRELQPRASLEAWELVAASVAESIRNDEEGVTSVRDTIWSALRDTGLDQRISPDKMDHCVNELLDIVSQGNKALGVESSGREQTVAAASSSAAHASQNPSPSPKPDVDTDDSLTPAHAPLAGPALGSLMEASETGTSRAQGVATSGEPVGLQDTPIKRGPSLKGLIMAMARRIVGNTGTVMPALSGPLADMERVLRTLRDGSNTDQADANGAAKEPEHEQHASEQPDDAMYTMIPPTDELFGIVVTLRNKVRGEYVTRIEAADVRQKWEVEWSVKQMESQRRDRVYRQLLKRRWEMLSEEAPRNYARHTNDWYFGPVLDRLTARGREFRRAEDVRARNRPVHVVGANVPLRWEDVF